MQAPKSRSGRATYTARPAAMTETTPTDPVEAAEAVPAALSSPEGETTQARGWFAALGHRDHTEGSLVASVAVLSVPAVAMSVLGMGTFQMFDLAFLGRISETAIAASGATNQVFRQFFMHIAWGISAAVTMRIAQYVGQRRFDEAEHVAGQGVLLGLAFGVIAALTVGSFPEPFLSLVAPPDVLPEATAYARVLLSFFGVMLVMQILNSVFTGSGDTTTPMLISFAQFPIAIFAQYTLAFGNFGAPELGIRGMAAGFIIGGSTALVIALWTLASGRARVHLRPRHFRPDPAVLADLLRNGWQPWLHLAARSVLIWIFMWLSGQLGSKVQAAYTIGLRIEMVMVMIAFPVANACATLVGQNLGAGNVARAWQAIRTTALLQTVVMVPVSLAVLTFRDPIASSFTSDPEVAALASEYLMFVSVVLSFYGIYFTAFRSLQAAGDMNTPMIISLLLSFGLGAPLAFALSDTDLGATGMWIANTTYALANFAIMVAWLWTGDGPGPIWPAETRPTAEPPGSARMGGRRVASRPSEAPRRPL